MTARTQATWLLALGLLVLFLLVASALTRTGQAPSPVNQGQVVPIPEVQGVEK